MTVDQLCCSVGLTRVEEKSDITALFPRYDTLGHTGAHWGTLGHTMGTTATYWESDQEIQILSRRDLPPPPSPPSHHRDLTF